MYRNLKKAFDIFRMTFLIAVVIICTALQLKTVCAGESSVKNELKNEIDNIISNQINVKDSKSIKLKKLFKYVEKYDYGRTMGFKASKGWTRRYAVEMYRQKKGSCYHYAAAYAYLVKKATGCRVRVVIGKTATNPHHAWTEIKFNKKWYICDVNRDKFEADSSFKYYMKKKASNAMKDAYRMK